MRPASGSPRARPSATIQLRVTKAEGETPLSGMLGLVRANSEEASAVSAMTTTETADASEARSMRRRASAMRNLRRRA